jgi:bifunctional DNase/RNase
MKGKTTVYVTIILIIVLVSIIIVNFFIYFSGAVKEKIAENIIGKTENKTTEYKVDLSDYEKVNISIIFTNVRLTSECYMISFDVTTDQAYSISRAVEGKPSERPLTHDIFMDILENFGIEVLAGMIDDFKDGIYYAKIYLKQGNKVLDLDARPSDTIALLLRLNMPLYIKKGVLKNSTYIC